MGTGKDLMRNLCIKSSIADYQNWKWTNEPKHSGFDQCVIWNETKDSWKCSWNLVHPC